ncbi:MAG: class I SAM-dependent methyltransferase [Comamonadaceae bacterium]|jgi:SAM-dependent methyltransferase|uniref:class I SAM-dependent methyltransferase n=1 Tax=Candidatus Skiveiella danica TaxID=3386177 RepID=UPI00390AAC5A|nr:class I SAM-dependent methyltransferase [Comamonadaceae bacterium]MBK6559401.1 class I SAM-dependent methyltransferase [Comamonadaceae bacterium]MBK7120189.1 class I SAM-dependent methyltransferase [Comamonadaceae bacterium]MBK7508855.1 class I SAM-dependent methyltransferase [Comamonadaceae bacterium]
MNSEANGCIGGLSARHGSEPVSAWVQRWSSLVPAGGTVLDVACGLGRHTRWFLARGHRVFAVDRSAEAIDGVRALAPSGIGERLETRVADLESGPWPFAGQRFDAVVVTNYLWRPLLPVIVDSVAPGGALIYETFAAGNEAYGKPSRADFLLQSGELLVACAGLRVVAFEDGYLDGPPRRVQRIAAVRAGADGSWPPLPL